MADYYRPSTLRRRPVRALVILLRLLLTAGMSVAARRPVGEARPPPLHQDAHPCGLGRLLVPSIMAPDALCIGPEGA